MPDLLRLRSRPALLRSGVRKAARAASQRSAGSRYQRSRTGRFRHAARQRRYRARLQKVTHQGSAATPAEVSSAASVPATALADPLTRKPPALAIAAAVRCHFCGEACSPFVRRRWLRRGAGTFRSIEPIRRTPPRPPRALGRPHSMAPSMSGDFTNDL